MRRAGLAVLALVLLGGTGALLSRSDSQAPLADVTIDAVSPGTRWSRGVVEAGFESVALEQGSAWFSVERNPSRVFRVSAGNVDVEVLGTRFLVERTGYAIAPGVMIAAVSLCVLPLFLMMRETAPNISRSRKL